MSNVHPTAVISRDAKLAPTASIGPFAVIGAATIGEGCVIHPHVVIGDGVELGEGVEIFPGAFLGKEPKGAGATARKPEFKRRIVVGANCSIGPHAVLFYDVEIGPNTLLGDGASIREQCRIGSRCIISRYVTLNYAVTVGDETKVMDTTHITGNTTLGKKVFVSTMVGTTNDNAIRDGYGGHIKGPDLDDESTVGAGATLLPAVKIGKKAMVASGAVVTKDVPEATTVAGIPARPMSRKG